MGLSEEKKKEFLKSHLPHRIKLLLTFKNREKSGYDYIDKGQNDLYCCVKDSSLIAIRFFMNFLGLKGISKDGNYELASFSGTRDDVQISEFIGRLILPTDISLIDNRRLLAGVYIRADKELAHLTSTFNDEFNEPDLLITAAIIIEEILKEHLGDKIPELNN